MYKHSCLIIWLCLGPTCSSSTFRALWTTIRKGGRDFPNAAATWLITIERECTKSHDRSQYRNHVAENTWRRMPPGSIERENVALVSRNAASGFSRGKIDRPRCESARSIDWAAAAFASLSIGANPAEVAAGRATDATRRRGEARDGVRRVARKNENRRREYEWKCRRVPVDLEARWLAGNSVHTQTLWLCISGCVRSTRSPCSPSSSHLNERDFRPHG